MVAGFRDQDEAPTNLQRFLDYPPDCKLPTISLIGELHLYIAQQISTIMDDTTKDFAMDSEK